MGDDEMKQKNSCNYCGHKGQIIGNYYMNDEDSARLVSVFKILGMLE